MVLLRNEKGMEEGVDAGAKRGWGGTAYMGELVWETQLPAFCPAFGILAGRWHDTGLLLFFFIFLGFLSGGLILFCNQGEGEGLVGNL